MLEPKRNYSNRKLTKHNFFYSLDCQSGGGLINPLLIELEKISNVEFKFYLKFILQKCINVNRNFSDAVEFLSIWMKKSPRSLFNQLKDGHLKQFFYRTEYNHDGDKWYFPKLLDVVSLLVESKFATASEILAYTFETFDFYSMPPEIFIREIIGYDRLKDCINESPAVFEQDLLLKTYEFIELNKKNDIEIDIGLESRRYLVKKLKACLVSWVTHSLFDYSNNKSFDRAHQYELRNASSQYANFRGNNNY